MFLLSISQHQMHSSYNPIQKNSYYLLLGIKKAQKNRSRDPLLWWGYVDLNHRPRHYQ